MKHKIYRSENILNDHYDNPAMNMFVKQYQHLYVKAESWEEYDDFELLIELRDGRVYVYDWLERNILRVKLIEDSTELTEEEWKRGFSYCLNKEIHRARFLCYDLAERVGITGTMLSRYLHGKSTPSAYVTQQIADVLGCDILDILPHDYIPVR